jgi:hypothetical protein
MAKLKNSLLLSGDSFERADSTAQTEALDPGTTVKPHRQNCARGVSALCEDGSFFPQDPSANELADHNGPGGEKPRAVLIVRNPLDSAVRSYVEPDDPLDFPSAIT